MVAGEADQRVGSDPLLLYGLENLTDAPVDLRDRIAIVTKARLAAKALGSARGIVRIGEREIKKEWVTR
jgi:hypothetical protein